MPSSNIYCAITRALFCWSNILICEEVQKNLISIGFEQGIISDKYEIGVMHFQDYIKNNIS